ncbi:hypothetical protein H1C71_018777, partial [Ictidomys tridecemlineatus]
LPPRPLVWRVPPAPSPRPRSPGKEGGHTRKRLGNVFMPGPYPPPGTWMLRRVGDFEPPPNPVKCVQTDQHLGRGSVAPASQGAYIFVSFEGRAAARTPGLQHALTDEPVSALEGRWRVPLSSGPCCPRAGARRRGRPAPRPVLQ